MAQAIAKLRKYPTSPRKMRYVIDMIRGRGVEEALNILEFSNKSTSGEISKLLRSAIANWKQKNEGMREEDAGLIVKAAFVDQGVTLKRWLPAPHGRANRKRKRANHVTLIVDSKMPSVQSEVKETAAEIEASTQAEVKTKPVKKSIKKPAAKKAAKKKTGATK
jgi:large subunit ribosomal protein L22